MATNKKTCTWTEGERSEGFSDGLWQSSCGLDWLLTNDSSPKENEMHYCTKCGLKLVEGGTS